MSWLVVVYTSKTEVSLKFYEVKKHDMKLLLIGFLAGPDGEKIRKIWSEIYCRHGRFTIDSVVLSLIVEPMRI